jgi:antimicrobial peptide system SdpB family protein
MNIKNIEYSSNFYPWNSNLGIARSLLATCTLLTIIFNNFNIIIDTTALHTSKLILDKFNFFLIFNNNSKEISIIILMLVISGYRPQLTCLLHWWIAFSFKGACIAVNGGDSIASIITLLLIPICLFDFRKNHWINEYFDINYKIKMFSYFSYWFLKIQIAYIYFDAWYSKMFIQEWKNGTAIWYYAHHSVFGFIDTPFIEFLLKNSLICMILTYSVLILEFFLAISIFCNINAKIKKIIFVIGIIFHTTISFEIGIISFGFCMYSALIILLLPLNKPNYEN